MCKAELSRGIDASPSARLLMDLQSIGANDIRFPVTHRLPHQHAVDNNAFGCSTAVA
jgi:hypothetical protein